MKEEVSSRILLLISKLNLNKNQLALKLGYANTIVSNITNLRNLPSFEFLYRLKNYDKKIDLNWLFTGEGNPFIDERTGDSSESIELYKTLIATLQSENALLKEKIANQIQSNDSNNI